jgi:hypothetical protein
MSLLATRDYPEVRAALRVGLDDNTLPDEVIGMVQYQGAAEAELLRRDSIAATRTGAAGLRVKSAAILLTAAYLAPAMPLPESETIEGGRYVSKLDTGRTALAESLRARAFAELALAMGLTPETPGGLQVGSITISGVYYTATETGYVG